MPDSKYITVPEDCETAKLTNCHDEDGPIVVSYIRHEADKAREENRKRLDNAIERVMHIAGKTK